MPVAAYDLNPPATTDDLATDDSYYFPGMGAIPSRTTPRVLWEKNKVVPISIDDHRKSIYLGTPGAMGQNQDMGIQAYERAASSLSNRLNAHVNDDDMSDYRRRIGLGHTTSQSITRSKRYSSQHNSPVIASGSRLIEDDQVSHRSQGSQQAMHKRPASLASSTRSYQTASISSEKSTPTLRRKTASRQLSIHEELSSPGIHTRKGSTGSQSNKLRKAPPSRSSAQMNWGDNEWEVVTEEMRDEAERATQARDHRSHHGRMRDRELAESLHSRDKHGSRTPSVMTRASHQKSLNDFEQLSIANSHAGSMQTFSTTVTDSPKPLRQMLVPKQCIEEFLARAQANTAKDIETLATLLGVKERIRDVNGNGKRTVYRVTTVFIPQQEGKSDQCASTEAGDAELVEHVFKHGLKQLGWIHTHPSWGCFMSSVDLHNALGFQLDLPESISIVCSRIEDKANGIFRVTVPEGIEELLNCDRTGFHSHPDKLFGEVTDGSVIFVDGSLTVVDCRRSTS